MKTHLASLLCFAAATLVTSAQQPVPVSIAPTPAPVQLPASTATTSTAQTTDQTRFTAEQLEQLLGPIALYPDALIALMLPAATVPADIVLAARYLDGEGHPASAAGRAWEESVKSLVHYPDVVKWMDANLEWTKQVGEAFREQPADVMDAIQRLRAKARAAGTLVDSPQQQVLVEQDVISLVPAQADTLYIPYYDPAVVYYAQPPSYYDSYGSRSFVTFSAPFAVGAWLAFDCDWRRRTVWTAERHWAARPHHDWRRPVFPGHPGYVHDPRRRPWHPSPHLPRSSFRSGYARADIVRPAPIHALPRPPAVHDNSSPRHPPPRDRAPNNDGRIGATRPGHTFSPGPPPISAPRTPSPATPIHIAPAPTITAPPPLRRADTDRGRNPSTDRAADRSNRAQPPGTPPAPRPVHHAASPAAPVVRHNPPVTGSLSGPRQQPAAQPPRAVSAPAPRAVPASPQTRSSPPPPPPAAATPAPAQPAPDERKRGGRDGDPNKLQH